MSVNALLPLTRRAVRPGSRNASLDSLKPFMSKKAHAYREWGVPDTLRMRIPMVLRYPTT